MIETPDKDAGKDELDRGQSASSDIDKIILEALQSLDGEQPPTDWSPFRGDLERHAESDIIPLREAARTLLTAAGNKP